MFVRLVICLVLSNVSIALVSTAVAQEILSKSSPQDDDQVDRARRTFNAGLDDYFSGNYADGVKKLRQALLIHPNPPLKYYNAIAWFCATCPEKNARNGFIAVSAAEHICEETKYAHPFYLDTYAAALAEMGDFDAALKWQEKAVELAPSTTTTPTIGTSDARFHLQLYRRHLPYRDVPDEVTETQYKRIVGAPISGASLRQINNDQRSKLVEFLNTLPETDYMGASPDAIREHYDILLLLVVSERGLQQCKDAADRLPDMTPQQIETFRSTLIAEREEAQRKAEQSLVASNSQSQPRGQNSGSPTYQQSAADRGDNTRSEQTVFKPEIKIEPKITFSSSPPKKAVDIIIHSVSVYGTRENGKPWDKLSLPDLKVCIRNLATGQSFTTPTKSDTESADFNSKSVRVSEGQKIEVSVIDEDVAFDDTIGTYEKEITAETMKQGKVEWSFDRVSSLVLEFQP